jgi:CRP/FNR family cyclic AMP-dependent transcriptional regulator
MDSQSILTPDEVVMFKKLACPIQVKEGYVIFGEDDHADCVYLIEKGHVKTYHSSKLGKIFMISIRKPGDIFGIAAVLLGEKRCVFAAAIENCTLWRMEGKVFIDMLHQCPRLAVQIATLYGRYLRDTDRAIGNLMSLDVNCRVAWLLVKLAGTVSTPQGEKLRIEVPLTHQDMANMIGTCRQTVTTILGQFKKEGMIHVGKQFIEITNFDKLNQYIV